MIVWTEGLFTHCLDFAKWLELKGFLEPSWCETYLKEIIYRSLIKCKRINSNWCKNKRVMPLKRVIFTYNHVIMRLLISRSDVMRSTEEKFTYKDIQSKFGFYRQNYLYTNWTIVHCIYVAFDKNAHIFYSRHFRCRQNLILHLRYFLNDVFLLVK